MEQTSKLPSGFKTKEQYAKYMREYRAQKRNEDCQKVAENLDDFSFTIMQG